MTTGNSFSIVAAGDIAKPVDTLVRRVSKFIGAGFAPGHRVRMAHAEAQAMIIAARADADARCIAAEGDARVELTRKRALERLLAEETARQENMEAIANGSLPLLTAEAKPERVADDWMGAFFDRCRLVSDDQMRRVWSRLLAGEANAPGTYSKRTINFLADASVQDAALVSRLAQFCLWIPSPMPMVKDFHMDVFRKNDMTFATLQHLDSIGVINFDHLQGFIVQNLARQIDARYGTQVLQLRFPSAEGNRLAIGQVTLTAVGHELVRLCEPEPIVEYQELLQVWLKPYLNDPNDATATDLPPVSVPASTRVG